MDLLIRGFHDFVSNHTLNKKIVLYIAGDGPQKRHLKDLSTRLKINKNIVFLGNIDKQLIKGYLKKVDGAIYTSVWDSFALSFLEALACADCPVYFSKKAGIYDFTIKDGYNLNGFNPSVKNISNIISDIIEQTNGQKIVELQKKFAEKYTWENVIDYYIEIYNEVG